MPTYVALLRGVNVSGHKTVKMDRLSARLEELGFHEVRTYLQSGNVVFKTANSSAAGLRAKMEQKIHREFGFPVPVILRTSKELAGVVRRNPFLREASIDQSRLYVTFLSSAAAKDAIEALEPLLEGSEQLRVDGGEIFLHCPAGYGRTKISNVAIEKKLSLQATTRNWNTTRALLAMAA